MGISPSKRRHGRRSFVRYEIDEGWNVLEAHTLDGIGPQKFIRREVFSNQVRAADTSGYELLQERSVTSSVYDVTGPKIQPRLRSQTDEQPA